MTAHMPITRQPTSRVSCPASDVSPAVGLVGLAGLFAWILFCRNFPSIAPYLGLDASRGVLSGPNAALFGLLASSIPMILWSVLVDKVHRRPSTGIDWSDARPLGEIIRISAVKIIGLWTTFAILAFLYGVCRWYWHGQYLFAMDVFKFMAIPMVVLAVPYILWLDRVMVQPRDHLWHFGAMLTGRQGWQIAQVKKHWRAWIIKGFFGAFMISILPNGFYFIVQSDLTEIVSDPVRLAILFVELLFVIDVQIGTVGYLVTMRPLDAQIRSGNPFVSGWVAALICYPPFVFAVIGGEGVLAYEVNTPGWAHWLEGQTALLYLWGAWLVFLTAIYAWATVAFGLRFSNLTYRGVITTGPYRFTRHPAYLSKNLFWWCATMPFLVSSDTWVDVIRNTFFISCVSVIYYWRARTEEAHLLHEDPKYREYYEWMAEYGIITARLTRLSRYIRGYFTRSMAQPTS